MKQYTQEDWEYAFTKVWLELEEETGFTCTMPSGIEGTLRMWRLRQRVPLQVIVDVLELAFYSEAPTNDGTGMYFCKVIWNKISEAAARGWNA